MNRKFTKSMSLILILIILSSSIPSFAATFPDVKSKPKHWAYDHIEKMTKLNYITGYDDGTFRPNDSVNYLENLKLISNLISLTKEELSAGKMAYGALMTELKIDDWAHEAVIKSLYRGVVSEKELRDAHSKGLVTRGTKLRPDRLTISIYLAKAMGLEEAANGKPVIVLPYKESLQIDGKYHKYLSVLLDAKVLDPKGTGEGYFEPKSIVKRDAMAKMLSTAYDYLQKNPVKPVEPVEPEKPKEEVTISGTVVSIYDSVLSKFVTVRDKSNKETAYIINDKTKITVDNKPGTVANIIKGQDIQVITLKDDLNVIFLNVSSLEENIKGVVKSVMATSNKMTIDYEVDKTTKTLELSVDKAANIYVNDKKANLSDVKAGDKVELVTKNSVVLDIEATSKLREVEGLIVSYKENNKKYTVTIEDDKGIKSDYELSDKATIYRNNQTAKITDIRVGDKVYLELEYNVILEIDAIIVKKDIKGHITGISLKLNQSPEITVKNRETEKEETYTVSQNAYIKIDNAVVTSSELKVGYFIDAIVGGNEIIEVYADSVSSESMIRGKVKYVNPNRSEIELDVTSSDIGLKYGDEVIVRTAKDVVITDGRNINLVINHIRPGMNIVMFGTYDGITFLAKDINIRQ